MKYGMNSNEMQKTNRTLVLKTLLENGSMTRTDLSARIGLQKATITNIINEFLDLGIIAVDGESASGRRGELICLKLDGIYIMSISINRKDYRVSVYSVDVHMINHIRFEFLEKRDIYEIIRRLKETGKNLIEQYGKDRVIEICLGLPGPYIRKDKDVDREEFLVSGFEQLSWVNIHKELEETFGRPIISEHDAKLLAYAEWKCAEERQTDRHVSLVALGSVGFGIGAGIIINGKIVEGQLGIAGEIGHMGINYNGKHAQNGIQGTYEYCAGTESAVRYMLERLYEFPESPLTEKSSYWEILDAYKNGDQLAVYAIDKMAWMLGYGIASIVYIINPDCVILGADYPDLPEFLEKVQRSVSQFVHPSIMENVSIRCTKLKEDTILLGGYYIALEKLFKNNLLLERIRQALC